MHSFLTNQSLEEFIEMTSLPQEKRQEYLSLLPNFSEEERGLLFNTLVEYYMLDIEGKRAEESLVAFREFAKDSDYDKLTKQLEDLEKTVAISQ